MRRNAGLHHRVTARPSRRRNLESRCPEARKESDENIPFDKSKLADVDKPVLAASNIRYEFSERDRGFAYGGIGAFHLLARRIGLIDAIDERLHLLKIHLPYHESDHVLNFAYN
ncbi:MAG TPA: hypothetical protein VHR72_11905, partial [Gemmataceae bacterium]|nr:hypothetical protein [Gemmataceae bacterium]